MTLPPFYYKGVSEDGLYSYFAQLIAAVGAELEASGTISLDTIRAVSET